MPTLLNKHWHHLPRAEVTDLLDAQPDTLLADRTNMLYFSTLTTYGTGQGVVATIGDTEIGRFSELISSAQVLATPGNGR